MKSIKRFFIIFFVAILICNCNKDVIYVDNLPQLELRVVNASGNPVDGAIAKLFSNEEDFKNSTNPVFEKMTNETGTALFVNLEEITYYFFVEKENLNNALNESSFEEQLKINEKKIIKVILN